MANPSIGQAYEARCHGIAHALGRPWGLRTRPMPPGVEAGWRIAEIAR
jgi:hypothetical protein